MKVNKSEYGVRFGCGAIFGFIVGFFVVSKYYMDISGPLKNGIAVAILFGILAAVLGDKFWTSAKWWRDL
ncbi:hypothetical protein L0244_06930 [bacterium]|nr:hypothetical protein [bacterium]